VPTSADLSAPAELDRGTAERVLYALRAARPTLARLGCGLATRWDHAFAARHPTELRLASRMSPRRRHDFLGGRTAMRRALAEAGLPQPTEPILIGDAGEPRLPDGVAASISHSRGIAIALAAPVEYYRAVGVDLELSGLPGEAAHLLLTEPERAWLDGGDSPGQREHRLLAAFSAKESVRKALDPALAGRCLRQIHLIPGNDSFLAWPRDRRDLRLRVWVRPVGAGVLTWTVVPAGRNRPR
jgi:4'-phosphopantetheinyl transferase EntD